MTNFAGMRSVYIFCFCLMLSMVAAAQKGQVTEVKDPLIDSLIAKRLSLYQGAAEFKPGLKPVVSDYGYRVQIFYGSDRRETFNQQTRFRNIYPKINTYIIYKEPNYYLRVGDFRTRLEAQQLLNELRPGFPTLFIFREKINAPNLDSNNNDQK